MDSKNTIAAIALSSAVIVLYSLFFVPEKSSTDQNLVEKEKIEQSSDTPILEQKETFVEISRKDALIESERVEFENPNVIGSISLKGAVIDDLIFKNYNVNLIFHAAAYKHVGVVEQNPLEGLRNNLLTTRSICRASLRSNVKKMILVLMKL